MARIQTVWLIWLACLLSVSAGAGLARGQTDIAKTVPADTADNKSPVAVQASAAALSGSKTETKFELTLSEGVTAEIFTLSDPYRVIIDLPDVTFQLPAGTGTNEFGVVKAFRYGSFAENKARIVIDTLSPVAVREAKMDRSGSGNGVILKLVFAPVDAATYGAGTGPPESQAAANSEPAASEEAPPVKPNNAKAKPVIVIDPGHGGIDPGAMGISSVPEKTVVLSVAQQLRDVLAKSGRYEVKMTRAKDVFISLDKRVKFSHDNAADLFVSLHADSIEEKNLAQSIRGATVYTLSERASSEQARLMAEKENASDLLAGLDTGDDAAKDQVKSILIDLIKRETSNFSADFSHVLVRALAKSLTLARDPQRSAAFKVLKQSHAPSVLIELGYMSNSAESAQMVTADWQNHAAKSIAAAIDTYFAKRTAEHP